MVVIRPGIADVLGEAALERLALFSSTDNGVPGVTADAEDGSADVTDPDAEADVDANANAQEEP